MSTLRAVWEKPDYTGVIAEAPLATLVPPYLAPQDLPRPNRTNRYFTLNIPPDARWRLLSEVKNAPEAETCIFLEEFQNEMVADSPCRRKTKKPIDDGRAALSRVALTVLT